MSSTTTINLSNAPKSPQMFNVIGSPNSPKGQVIHVGGSNNFDSQYPMEASHISTQPQGVKLAYTASNYPTPAQQQQYQQQYQMQQQYQPVQSPNQPQYFQSQEDPYQRQPQYYQAQYQPQEQYQQQYQSQPQQHHAIQIASTHPHMAIHTKDTTRPPVYEAPVEKLHVMKKNQPISPKIPQYNMQQSFRSSRSGSFSALEEITDPPHFIKHPAPHQVTTEGDPISLSARVTPAGDPNLAVQWYKDGKPLAAGSRFNTSFERGFAILDILYTFKEDSGEYSCVAKNTFGMDQTTPSVLNVRVEENVISNSRLPQEMADNIAAMEANLNTQKVVDVHSEAPTRPPQFVKPIPGLYNLVGGQSVHLETRVIPVNDPSLIIEWFKNGKALNSGCRHNVIFDRGFAILDINGLISEDSGDYFCYARNAAGQAQSNIVRLVVASEERVLTKSQLPQESIQYLQALDAVNINEINRSEFRYVEEEEPESLPHFDIKPVDLTVSEGSPARFLIKVSGYPRPHIQWFMNDELVVSTSIQRVYNDGCISYLEFRKCKTRGDSHIVAVAKNKLGEAVANSTLTVIPEDDFRPELKQIDPENPFRKLATLKKVDISPELQNAFKKQKPYTIHSNLYNSDKGLSKSKEACEAENMYTNIQSMLRRSDKLSYAGAPTGGQAPVQGQTYVESAAPAQTMTSSQITMQIGKSGN